MFLIVFLLACFILAYYNQQNYLVPPHVEEYASLQTSLDKPYYKSYNPSGISNFNSGYTITVSRYTSHNYCPSSFFNSLVAYHLIDQSNHETEYSHLRLKVERQGQPALFGFLDTRSISSIGQFEDPRILALDSETIAVACTLYIAKTTRMCIFFVKPLDLLSSKDHLVRPSTAIQYFSRTQRQKNWMMRLESQGTLLLHASLDTVYSLNFNSLVGLTNQVEIPDVQLTKWSGSTPFRNTPMGLLCLVHRRSKSTVLSPIPKFVNAFVLMYKDGSKQFSQSFVLYAEKCPTNFTYVSGLDVTDTSFVLYLGIHDCYAVKASMTYAFVEALFANKDSAEVLKIRNLRCERVE